ncbi:hypothetical protein MSG28_012918 [Choristoneura fumiferana]|uniref:Uncharacterized protein n=1 Tax=Choristoneura fumiferana TaxID=7141 RepID=A0ACC0KR20_CHOFU|nr:hypothetical protein MSG28_012918 [Choristoneura fumiferana]
MNVDIESFNEAGIVAQNVEPEALQAIVDYIYNPDSLVITEDNVQGILSGASLVAVSGARAAACGWLAAALAPDNALGIKAFADLHSCADLAAAAQRFIDHHFLQVLESDEFLALQPDALAALIDSDRITVPNEEVILDAVIRWMQHGPEERSGSLGRLLAHVRLPLLAREALVARAAAEPLASAPVAVKDLLIEALSLHVLRGPARAAAAAACPRARPRRPPRARAPCSWWADRRPRPCGTWRPTSWTPRAGGPPPRCPRAAAAPAWPCSTTRCWPSAGSTVSDNQLPAGRRALSACHISRTLRVRSVDVYNVAADVWSAGPPLAARRSTLGVAVIDRVVYAVGGFDGTSGLSSAEALSPGAAEWRPVASMRSRRSSVGVAALGGRLYAVGGYDGAARQCLQSVERYDPPATRGSPWPTCRCGGRAPASAWWGARCTPWGARRAGRAPLGRALAADRRLAARAAHAPRAPQRRRRRAGRQAVRGRRGRRRRQPGQRRGQCRMTHCS